jgi:hypothetical protein
VNLIAVAGVHAPDDLYLFALETGGLQIDYGLAH